MQNATGLTLAFGDLARVFESETVEPTQDERVWIDRARNEVHIQVAEGTFVTVVPIS